MKRIIQPILLGVTANIVINYVFDPNNPDFLISEFLVAILLSFPITELNRSLDARLVLNNTYVQSFSKRLLLHLAVLLFSIVLILNIIGNLYLYLKDHTFHSFQEMVTINVVSFFIAIFLTGFNWMGHYFNQWKLTESKLLKSEHELLEVIEKQQETKPIQIKKGKKS